MDEPQSITSDNNEPPSGARKLRIKIKKVQSNSSYQKRCIVQNFLLIWLDVNIDQSTEDCQNTLAQIQTIVNNVNIFTQLNECIKFLTAVNDMRIFLIVEHLLARRIVPLIHDIPQLDVIYIFCHNKSKHHKPLIKRWDKAKGVHTEIMPICESLQQVVKQCNQNFISMSFLEVDDQIFNRKLEQLDIPFLYTQIFKAILLEMVHNEQSIKDFILFWRYHYINNKFKLNLIDEFERDYRPESSIWWYTRDDFVYQMLNQALHRSEINIIMPYLSPFLHDLKQQIEQLHKQQVKDYQEQSFIVYRGQGLSISNFEKLLKIKGGLISFNSFLSTSKNKEASLIFAENASVQTDMVGILFKMSIDPSISSVPFASIREVSYTQTEEFLFSMNTVFRVGEITRIEKNSPLYEVELKLTADDDQQLHALIEHIRDKTEDYAGWKNLTRPLTKLNPFHNPEVRNKLSLKHISGNCETVHSNKKFVDVKGVQDAYEKAIWCCQKMLGICERTLPPNHLNFATICNDFAIVYRHMGEYSKVLSLLEKALEIQTEGLPSNHPDLGILYNNIGVVYSNMKEHSKALSSHKKAIHIYETFLPPNHSTLIISYDNLAAVYYGMKEYSKALSYHEKALASKKEVVPPNDDDLITSYTKIGIVCQTMKEYSKAVSSYETTLEIQKKRLHLNHDNVIISYNQIAFLYHVMGEFSKVISTYEKLIEFQREVLPPHHPSLPFSYNNIAKTYRNMKEYSKAISFYEKALEISREILPPKHPDLAYYYNDIGEVYQIMGENSKALSFHEKALQIRKDNLPSNDPSLAASYSTIGVVYGKMNENVKALWFHDKALEIRKDICPPNNSALATSYSDIGELYVKIGETSKALSFHQKALEIRKEILPSNHPDLATSYVNVGNVYQNMGENLKALSFHEKAVEIFEKILPANHPFLITAYHDLGLLCDTLGEDLKARSVRKKLCELLQTSLSSKIFETTSNGIETIEKNKMRNIPRKKHRRINGNK